MSYRKRIGGSKKYNIMRAAKLRQIQDGPLPDYPLVLPDLRRRIVLEDFDFGEIRHEINLYKTNRIDCYRMEIDGTVIAERMGWTRVLGKLRKAFLRVQAT
jgi:hypothetical protein